MNSDFQKYLQNLKISSRSIKNYKSDIAHFISWAKKQMNKVGTSIESLEDLIPFLSFEFANKYLNSMIEGAIPQKTINRHLSSMRHLSKFLIELGYFDFDFMNETQNVSKKASKSPNSFANHVSIIEFKSYLEAEKVSNNTIKNYLSDIRQFMDWLDKNHAQTS